MGSIHLEPAHREILLRHSDWKFVSSLVQPDEVPLSSYGCSARLKASQEHFHPARQIVIALDGESTYILGGRVYRWKPGVFFFHDVYELHDDGRAMPGQPLTYLEITLHRDCFAAFVVRYEDDRRHELSGSGSMARPFQFGFGFEQLWLELSVRRSLPASVARMLLFSSALMLVGRLLDSEGLAELQRSSSTAADVVETICENMRATGARGATLESLARIANYSRCHFARVFRNRTGMSVHSYIDRCRAEKAAELLARGLTHTQIASALGFSSLSVFCRWQRQQERARE